MNCPKCGVKLEADAVFCTSCGAKVETPKNVCVKCGAELKEDAVFCEQCGARCITEENKDISIEVVVPKVITKTEEKITSMSTANSAKSIPVCNDNNAKTSLKKTAVYLIAVVLISVIVVEGVVIFKKHTRQPEKKTEYSVTYIPSDGTEKTETESPSSQESSVQENQTGNSWIDINDGTSYKKLSDICAMVKMVKPKYTETYEITFYSDYFIVESVSATTEQRNSSLQNEVGIKQLYSKNPCVAAVRTALGIGISDSNSGGNIGDSTASWEKGNQLYKAKRYMEAKDCFVEAANSGNVQAMTRLGVMYKYGIGMSKDDVEAFNWYKKAAENGEKDAMNRLGAMYKFGWGTSQDSELAVHWFRESADRGNPTAMYNLGTMYESGSGIQKDGAEAISWYKKAAEGGDKNAKKKLQQLGE